MPSIRTPVSLATRNIIQAELLANATPAYINKTYGVSLPTIYRYRNNLRAFSEVWPQSGLLRGPVPKLDAEAKEVGDIMIDYSYRALTTSRGLLTIYYLTRRRTLTRYGTSWKITMILV
jgi:hypothetical protein